MLGPATERHADWISVGMSVGAVRSDAARRRGFAIRAASQGSYAAWVRSAKTLAQVARMITARRGKHGHARGFRSGGVFSSRIHMTRGPADGLIAADEWGAPREWKLRQICGLPACGEIGRDAHNGRSDSIRVAHV